MVIVIDVKLDTLNELGFSYAYGLHSNCLIMVIGLKAGILYSIYIGLYIKQSLF